MSKKIEDYIGHTVEEFSKLNIPFGIIKEDNSIYLSCSRDARLEKEKEAYFLYLENGLITEISLVGKPFPSQPQLSEEEISSYYKFKERKHLNMVQKDKWVWFRKKRVELGDGHIIQYTLFESKKLFGVIIYHWKTIKQNRFHSHAFPAYAFLLSGSYTEEVIENGQIVQKVVNNRLKRRYIPQNYIHRILKAEPRTWTIVFTGKWADNWYEYFQDKHKWVKYTWGRKKVAEIDGNETLDIINK